MYIKQTLLHLILVNVGIPMFYIKNLTMYKVQMHAGAIRKLLYDLCDYTGDNPLDLSRGLFSRTHTL